MVQHHIGSLCREDVKKKHLCSVLELLRLPVVSLEAVSCQHSVNHPLLLGKKKKPCSV